LRGQEITPVSDDRNHLKKELKIALGGFAVTFLILGGIGMCSYARREIPCNERSFLDSCGSGGSSESGGMRGPLRESY